MVAKKTEVEKIQVMPAGEGRWAVSSGSTPGASYEVILQEGQLICNCMAGLNGRNCKHQKAVLQVEEMKETGKVKETTKEEKSNFTKLGYVFGEVTSAYQKEVRRGDEEAALWWGMELYETSMFYFWKRTLIIACEDVGDAEVVQKIAALMQGWEFCKKTSWYVDPQSVVMAILILCRAKKSTEVDDAKNLILHRRAKGLKPPIPLYALDVHTQQGKQMGATEKDWYRERNQTIAGNQYREKLIAENPGLFGEVDLEQAEKDKTLWD